MGIVVVLVVLALIFGGIGIIAHALWWLLVIAAVLLVASIVTGIGRRRV